MRQSHQAVRRSLTLFGSEPQLQCEFECPPVVEGVRDLAEIILAQGLPGLGELGVIEEIQRFSTEQHGAVAPQEKSAGKSGVDVPNAIFAEGVSPQVSDRVGRQDERECRCRQELDRSIGMVDPAPEHRRVGHIRAVARCPVGVADAGGVRARAEGKGRAGLEKQNRAELPVAEDLAQEAVLPTERWRLVVEPPKHGVRLVEIAQVSHLSVDVEFAGGAACAGVAAPCGVGVVRSQIDRLAEPIRRINGQSRPARNAQGDFGGVEVAARAVQYPQHLKETLIRPAVVDVLGKLGQSLDLPRPVQIPSRQKLVGAAPDIPQLDGPVVERLELPTEVVLMRIR